MPFHIQRRGGHSETSEDGKWEVQISDAWADTEDAYVEITVTDATAHGDHKDHPYFYLLMPCPYFSARHPETDVTYNPKQITIDLAAQSSLRMTVGTHEHTLEVREIQDTSVFPQMPVLLTVVAVVSLVVGTVFGWATAALRNKNQMQNNGRHTNA